jgi:hypothetical protein
VRQQARHGGCGDPRQVHEVHEHGGRFGAFERGEPRAQRRPHALGPVVGHHSLDARGQQRADRVRLRSQHHDNRCAATLGEHTQRAPHERLAVQLDERLGPAHPAARAAGEQQAGGPGYLLISVTGCT